MAVFRSLMSSAFANVAFWALCTCGWKKRTVYANLLHMEGAESAEHREESLLRIARPVHFYRMLIRNLTRHAGEILFRFGTFKKLPRETSAYPCRIDGWNFALAEGSAPVLEKMRAGGIFLTAHFGNYEAIGPWLCRLGIPLVASYIPLRPAWLNRILDKKIRTVDGRPYGVDAHTPREFLRLLDSKKLVCLLADQDSRIPSALDGEFLHRPVRNNPLPDFLLKHRPETPVYICWLDDSDTSQKARVLHAVELPCASDTCNNSGTCNNSRPCAVMPAFNAWLESRIKENPALWYGWTHRRFYSRNPEIYGQACPRNK